MSLLKKLGLAPKKRKSDVPIVGEKLKKEREAYSLKRNPYIRLLIFIGFIAISIFALPLSSIQSEYNYTVGQPWRMDDLTAPYTFAVNKPDSEIKEEKDAIRKNIPPIYKVDNKSSFVIQSKIDSLYREVQFVLDAQYTWQKTKLDTSKTSFSDSLRFSRVFNETGHNFDDTTWDILFKSYNEVQAGTLKASDFVGATIKKEVERLIDQLLAEGIINEKKSELTQNEITVRNSANSTEKTINMSRFRDQKEANDYAKMVLKRVLNEDNAHAAAELYNKVIQPNFLFSPSDTESRVEEAIANISETKDAIAQGQVIIRKGDLVTQEKANVIKSLEQTRSKYASNAELWFRYLGGVITVIVISLVFYFYLMLYRNNISRDNSMFLLVFLTLSLVSLCIALVFKYELASPYLVPVAIAPIILTIIFDSRVGLIAALTLASLVGLVNGNDFEITIATITACSMGVFSVRDIKDRAQFFFITPGIVFATYLVVITGFTLAKYSGWEIYLNQVFFIAINAIFILFTYPLILLLEKLFGVVTDFTLLELGDTNQPLQKELLNRAPGTFHHSLQVAGLAEAAAAEIGANPLLCRIGALYHDIGKIKKPNYFIENQGHGSANEHDKLTPQMSAKVIKAHVSDGIEMAKEHKLPEPIIDFIRTHHGNSVIKYFYEKAKSDESPNTILTEDLFRYDGPLPSTKETGILLLADGIEAASRSMKNHSYTKLENLINKMVDDRVKEGQLNQCPITFDDLNCIKNAFLQTLSGIYHGRIEYPEDEENSAKETEKISEQPTTKKEEE